MRNSIYGHDWAWGGHVLYFIYEQNICVLDL